MSRADGRRADLGALLYIPDEALVRSTIEGNDTDWSDTLAYVPAELLVGSVLLSSRRERPRFRLPSSLEPGGARDSESSGLARMASALFALIGTSPASLAAATTAHIVIFAAIAPWVVGQVRTASTLTWSRDRPATAERIVYLSPSRAIESPIRRRPRRPGPTALTVTPDTVAVQRPQTGWSTSTDSGGLPASRTLERSLSSPDVEVAAALHQEFLLTGDGIRIEQFDAPRFELLVRVLALRPRTRLLVRGAGPRLGRERERDTGLGIAGMREAEAFKRLLVDAGISPERIDVEAMPERDGNRPCPEREPLCAGGRSRVQTMMGAPGPNRP
jgi:hypothetical protein